MDSGLLQLRKLTLEDSQLVQQMHTDIEDDYILTIFPDLVSSEANGMFGLYSDQDLLAIAGYTLFPGGYAMLGRLRSDKRFHSKGHATEILSQIRTQLERDPTVKWIGANTNINNKPARRVLEKLGFDEVTQLYSLAVQNPNLIEGLNGPIWNKVDSLEKKKSLLSNLYDNALGVFPYECYYPFPYTEQLVTDEHLKDSHFFQNHDQSRFFIIRDDQKQDWFAQVKYFWNDHFKQPGFWETIFYYVEHHPEQIQGWVEFSLQGYQNIPNKEAFEKSDGWVLYGKFKEK
ncbi:GNAT family N-acetyltransferase [Aquibacillus kalidii]|uniref:GNAT family N-acetyltransferase n=1 Tax=Aquibacillus kalidii TaxID=2762597 RepID=UPI0016442116|nr:GNAT family N-acetyltransferase [Aquibacillus kalidii]